jgi:hypothetical protein
VKRRRRKRWVAGALRKRKRGALHRQLGVPANKKIPLSLLKKAASKPGLLGRRARLAMTMRGFKHVQHRYRGAGLR